MVGYSNRKKQVLKQLKKKKEKKKQKPAYRLQVKLRKCDLYQIIVGLKNIKSMSRCVI